VVTFEVVVAVVLATGLRTGFFRKAKSVSASGAPVRAPPLVDTMFVG
jgi:hypothetical protein